MSDRVNLLKKAENLEISPEFDGYSKVIIHIDDETIVEAGNDTGRVLEVDNPFGTQSMANEMLAKLQGFQYQPYKANGAILDPAAEIGDAVSVKDIYGGIYSRERDFGKLMRADIAAPSDEEIDHEFKFVSATDRKYRREMANTRSELSIQATQIAAKVESDTSDNRQSFGWKLQSDSWEVFANNQTVLKATSSGLEVTGKITATTGKIGGFDIGTMAIYNNISSMDGTQSTGVYVGTDGIKLGQNFTVTTSGQVTASSLRLKGTITFLNSDGTSAGTLSAANLRKYANDAYSSACTSGGYCYGGAGGGYRAINAFDNGNKVSWLKAASLYGDSISLGGYSLGRDSMTVTTPNGDRTLYFVRW